MRRGYYNVNLCFYVVVAMVNGGLVPSPPARLSPLANLASNYPELLLNTSKELLSGTGTRGLPCRTTNCRDEKDRIRREENSPDDNNFSSKIILGSRNRRREILLSSATAHLCTYLPSIILHPPLAQAISDDNTQTTPFPRGVVFEIEDPNTYSAVVYVPRAKTKGSSQQKITEFPLLVVLHGAGNNHHSAMYEFTNAGSSSPGDHTNLPPYLLSREQAPHSLSDNFVVVAPYVGKGKSGSLYDEPRGKILSFIKWFNKWIESQRFEADGGASSYYSIGINTISLFGFSEGSTLAVELATTRQFNGVVLASYGFTGILPPLALERLYGIPFWVFHSKGDAIYDIRYSNQFVDSLVSNHGGDDVFDMRSKVKYTKLIPEKNSMAEIGLEHVRTALVVSKNDEVYDWLMSL